MRESEKLLNHAQDILKDAESAFEQDMLVSTVQNRIYYSIFHAAKAGLLVVDCDVGTHQGVKIKVGEELVQKGLLEKERGRFFSKQQTLREQADYRVDVDITRGELKKYIQQASKFLNKMEDIIKSEK